MDMKRVLSANHSNCILTDRNSRDGVFEGPGFPQRQVAKLIGLASDSEVQAIRLDLERTQRQLQETRQGPWKRGCGGVWDHSFLEAMT